MIALIQRVKEAKVTVKDEITGQISAGLLILLGIHQDDTEKELEWVAQKCAKLRIFADENDKMNLSVKDAGGQVLVVSQFTLYGDTRKGNRPSFVKSAPPAVAEPLYEKFIARMAELTEKPVPTGIFGAMMDVSLINDGPITIRVEKCAD